jgi:hypothetical protein
LLSENKKIGRLEKELGKKDNELEKLSAQNDQYRLKMADLQANVEQG